MYMYKCIHDWVKCPVYFYFILFKYVDFLTIQANPHVQNGPEFFLLALDNT